MPRRPSALVLVALAVIFFTLGLFSAWLRGPLLLPRSQTQPLAAPTETPLTSATGPTDQHIILVVGVDSLESPSQLRAVWYITYRTPGRNLFLLGLPVDLAPNQGDDTDFQAAFQWEAESGLGSQFLTLLRQVIPFDVDAAIVLDDDGFAALVDYLGGLELDGSRLEGEDIKALQTLLAADPAASLSTQAEILKALAARTTVVGSTPDLTPLIALLPNHAWTSRTISELVALAAPLLPLDPNLIHIDIY